MTPHDIFTAACSASPASYLGIKVGHVRIRIKVVGPALAQALFAPFSHLEQINHEHDNAIDLFIHAWSVAETGVAPLPGQPPQVLSEDGRTIICWFTGVNALTRMDIARPFQKILLPALYKKGLVALHGAIISCGRNAPGLLLIGPNGCGKSTTTFTALMDGFSMLGDDCVLIPEDTSSHTGFSLYNSCCLTVNSQQLLPPIHQVIHRPFGSASDSKGVLLMNETLHQQVIRTTTIGAAIFPIIDSTSFKSSLVPISAVEALRRLMPALRFMRLFEQQERLNHYHAVTKLITELPKFSLQLGTDMTDIPRTLRAFSGEIA